LKTKNKRLRSKNPLKSLAGKKHTVNDLLKIMARLRSPSGCPWDREQTEQTLKKYLIEESYEALEAIEAGNPKELKEELGTSSCKLSFFPALQRRKGSLIF